MEKQAGVIVVLTKNGDQGVKVPLRTNTPCSFGSSIDATVRMHKENQNLKEFHCIVNVDDKGFAVLMNKSILHPIVLNGKALLNEKVLVNNDIFEVCGRKFQYVNSRMTEEKAKLYRNKTKFVAKRTPLKSRVTMLATPKNVVPLKKQPITPKSSATNSTQLRNKQSLTVSVSKTTKNVNPRGVKSATKPKTIYSPVQTRRSLFTNAQTTTKGLLNTPKIPAATKENASEENPKVSLGLMGEDLQCDLIDFNSPVTNKVSPINVLDITKPTRSSRKRSINNVRKTPDSVVNMPDDQSIGESSTSEFLKNESLCKSTKKTAKVSSIRRFVTVRRARGRHTNFSFDSSSAGDQTPSKTNLSTIEVPVSPLTPQAKELVANSSKRKSTRDSLRVAKVRSKSLSKAVQSKSAKKRRCSVHATSAVSNKTLNVAENMEEEEQDMTTPVMTQNLSRKSLSAPRIHHMRISRLDDDINESVHMDDSVSETPVIHEISRRSLAKRSTARLQESLRLVSPSTEEPSLFENYNNANGTPDSCRKSTRFSEKDTVKTPLKTEDFSNLVKSDGQLSSMKVSITSTPKEQTTTTRSEKRKLQTSLNEPNFKRTKILTRSSSTVETEKLSKNETPSLYVFCDTPTRIGNTTLESDVSRKSRSRLKLDQENLISNETSLLESTAVSSIVYETSFSKIERRTPMSEKKELQKIPSSAENVVKLDTPDNLNNISGIETLYASPIPSTSKSIEKGIVEPTKSVAGQQKSPKNDLSEIVGVKKLMQTPKKQKSPKNDLTNIRSLRRLMQTPREQKSPKNDLTNIPNLRRLMHTPREQKSPKNDLTNIPNLRRLMQTPKEQKSPKNDLTQVFGVKKLMQTPKEQKSPKNDLTNIPNLRRLIQTPKEQKSPKNDLTDIVGVRKLMQTPKQRKSPKNDLTQVSGVKKLLRTPKEKKSPKNDLTRLYSLRLLQTPKNQKSPKNDLTRVSGVKALLRTPRAHKEPKNDLENVSGVKELFEREEEFAAASNAFDKLVQRKPIITYRGKSVSPAKSNKNLTSTRHSTESTDKNIKPEVEKWLLEQRNLKHAKKSSKRKHTEDLQGDKVPRKRATRKANHVELGTPVVTSTIRSTRGKKANCDDDNAIKAKSTRSQKGKKDDSKDISYQSEESFLSTDVIPVQAPYTRTRKRFVTSSDESLADVAEKLQNKKSTRTRHQNKKSDIENGEFSVNNDATPQEQKSIRSRRQNTNKETVTQNEESYSNADSPAQELKRTRTLRQKKNKDVSKESIGSVDTSLQERKTVVTPQSRTKTRDLSNNNKGDAVPNEKSKRTRARAQVVVEEPAETTRTTRRAKKTNTEEQSSIDEKKNEVKVTRNRVTRQKKVSPVKFEDKKTEKRKVHFENVTTEKASTPRKQRQRKFLNTEELNEIAEVEPLVLRRSARRK